jgi:hypothetical protein
VQAPRFNPKKLGLFFIVLAVVMFVVEQVWKPVFTLPITESFGFPVWVLSAIYGALQVYIWQATQKHVPLTNAEVAAWGPRLEEATPTILEMYQDDQKVGDIATSVEKKHGIPPEITIRYIIALGQHMQAGSDEPDEAETT